MSKPLTVFLELVGGVTFLYGVLGSPMHIEPMIIGGGVLLAGIVGVRKRKKGG